MIDGWTKDARTDVPYEHPQSSLHQTFEPNLKPLSFYRTLDSRFLQAMDEIGLYGLQKYGAKSFESQCKNGTLKRMERTESAEIGEHITEHYRQYMAGELHDHFQTERHQLAAAAFNAMMEYVYATVADGESL